MQNNPRRLDYHFKLSLSVAHNQRWVGVGLKFCSFASFLCKHPPPQKKKQNITNIISVQMPVRRVCLEGEATKHHSLVDLVGKLLSQQKRKKSCERNCDVY